MTHRIGIIGGGIAGLVAAYELSKAGAQVTIVESGKKLGGLAGSLKVDGGHEIEKYYHFICKPDRPYFEMMKELGLEDAPAMGDPRHGLLPQGAPLHPRGHRQRSPLPRLPLSGKVRFFLGAARSSFAVDRLERHREHPGAGMARARVRLAGLRHALPAPSRPEVPRVRPADLRGVDVGPIQPPRAIPERSRRRSISATWKAGARPTSTRSRPPSAPEAGRS